MSKKNDPDPRVVTYWDKQYKKLDAAYAAADLEKAKTRTRGLHGQSRNDAPGESASSGKRPTPPDRHDLQNGKARLLADINAIRSLLTALRKDWFKRLSAIDPTTAAAEGAIEAIARDVDSYRREFPFHLTGPGQMIDANQLRSDLVSLAAKLTLLAVDCANYRASCRRGAELIEAALKKRRPRG